MEATASKPGVQREPAEQGEQVVLVDESDREIGASEKIAAHRDGGVLHRAFSVFLMDRDGRMLIQQRAATKYHFARLWTNSCCGHPRPGEEVAAAARRRVPEELGVDVELRRVGAFVYSAVDGTSGLTEREYDHVFVGSLDADPTPDPDEIEAVAWRDPAELRRDVETRPAAYTPWFGRALEEIERHPTAWHRVPS